MKDLKEVVASNIYALRTASKMSQSALAEILNYSDKAVSKWERAESVPDVFVLKKIADYFGVTVDDLLKDAHGEPAAALTSAVERRNRALITCLATAWVWLIATFIFVLMKLLPSDGTFPIWLLYIYAIPASAIVLLVFNCIWGKRKRNFLIISFLLWGIILSVYLSFLTIYPLNIWPTFLLGAPAQIIVFLWSRLHVPQKAPTVSKPAATAANDALKTLTDTTEEPSANG